MGIKYEPLVTESLAKQISENLRQAIMDGDLKTDERLPTEPELAARFGVSRPTIREALKRLAAQNLIRSRRGPSGGTFVNKPDSQQAQDNLTNMTSLLTSMGEFSLTEVGEARRELESICVRLAASRRLDDHLQRMADEIEIQKQQNLKDEDFCASDVRFHRALVDASQNAMLQFTMSAVIEAMQPVVNLIAFKFWDKAKTVDQHVRLLHHIKNQDADAAQAVLLEQMDDIQSRYAKAQALREK